RHARRPPCAAFVRQHALPAISCCTCPPCWDRRTCFCLAGRGCHAGLPPRTRYPPRPVGNRKHHARTTTPPYGTLLVRLLECANSSTVVRERSNGSRTRWFWDQVSRRNDRRWTASCSVACPALFRRARRTSRDTPRFSKIWNRGTTCAGQTCG